MHIVHESGFATEATADKLVNEYTAKWGFLSAYCLTMHRNFHLVFQSTSVFFWVYMSFLLVLIMPWVMVGRRERITLWLKCCDERQDDWNAHLPFAHFNCNNSVNVAAGLASKEVHIGRATVALCYFSWKARTVSLYSKLVQ